MARIPRDENVPAQLVEGPAQVVELLRAVGEPVQQYQRTLRAPAVDVQTSAAKGVDVGSIEGLEAAGDLNSSLVRVAGHSRYGILSRGVDFELTAEQRAVRELCRDFAKEVVAPAAEDLDRNHKFGYDIVRRMGELGLFGRPFAEEDGRAGADFLSLCLAIEEISRADAGVGITLEAAVSLGAAPIHDFGTQEQKELLLPDLLAGRKLWAFGLTEPGAGSDAGATRTRAELEDGDWVINGSKQFITNSGTDISGCVTITAVTGQENGNKEISNIIVPNGTPGFEAGEPYRKMGWNASDTRPLSFDDCRVPEGNLLGPRGQGFKQFLAILDGGRIGVAAMGVGLAQGALDEAISYSKERHAFGQPIGKFQAIQAKIADLSAQIEAARLLVY